MRKGWLRLLMLLSGMALFCAHGRAQESLTITTYYPSPQGAYKTLKLQPHNTPRSCSGAADEGWMYYDSDLSIFRVCTNVGGVYAYRIAGMWDLVGGDTLELSNPALKVDLGNQMLVDGGIRAKKGDSTDADLSNVGYSFDDDGDTGMFAVGGIPASDSELVIRNDNVHCASFLEGANPGTVRFFVNGGAAKTIGGNVWEVWSDQRLKKNISAIDGGLAQLLRLQGKSYEWSDPETARLEPGVQMGFIAQDVEKVFPDWVHEDKDGIKTVALKGLDALVVEAVRELNDRLAAVEKEVAVLRAENAELRGKTAGKPRSTN